MTPEKLDPQKKAASHEEITTSSLIQQEALVRLLFRKGIIDREEYLEEVKAVTREILDRQAE